MNSEESGPIKSWAIIDFHFTESILLELRSICLDKIKFLIPKR